MNACTGDSNGSREMNSMGDWKDGKSTDQVARDVLRSYLIRCHRTISRQYPEVASMDPVNAADFLLHLRDTGRINIQLQGEGSASIGCSITEVRPE
jgi:hypothetical protein